MQNPNPLTYCKTIFSFGQLDPVFKAKQKYSAYQKKSFKLVTKFGAPSIPKKQHDPEMLTGKGADTAGPGKYQTNIAPIKQQTRKCSFGLSGVKREVFKVSDTPGLSSYKTDAAI